MAIRERKGRKSPWQCYWNNPITGKRESADFVTRLEAEKHDSLIKHRIKFDRESFQREEHEKNEEPEGNSRSLTLEACYLEYLKQRQFTKKGIEWQMDSMHMPLNAIGKLPVSEITSEHIGRIMKDMLATSVKPVSVRGRMSVLRTVMRWCASSGFCQPIEFPKLPPAHYEKFVPPTPEELQMILENASPHIARVVILGSQFGVRVGPSELLRLTWDDVDLERRILIVHGARKNLQAPWREVPIREGLIPVFEHWHKEDRISGATHIVNYKGQPVEKINKAWCATLRRAGISRRIRPYDLRHAFATELIASGTDIGTVAKLMGHASPTMILTHYQYVMNRQKREAVESLPDISYVSKNMCPKEKALTSTR